jgi:hypothetical protein
LALQAELLIAAKTKGRHVRKPESVTENLPEYYFFRVRAGLGTNDCQQKYNWVVNKDVSFVVSSGLPVI